MHAPQETLDLGAGIQICDLATQSYSVDTEVCFTFRWLPERWEGIDYAVRVTD